MGPFTKLLSTTRPLQIMGVPNALFAKMAHDVGFKALYLSGSAVAANQFALPDLGLLSLDTLVEEARRIVEACPLPLLVDIDNGWDHPLLIEEASSRFSKLGPIALQIEDQAGAKRCGHRDGITLVSTEMMCERIEALKGIEVIARTDALSIEGIDKTIQRCESYVKAGAHLLFVEAVKDLETIKTLKKALKIPLLINLTEFGKTPTFSLEELKKANVDALLYPVSLSRVIWGAGQRFLKEFQDKGSASFALDEMMTRKELYRLLDYEKQEEKIGRKIT